MQLQKNLYASSTARGYSKCEWFVKHSVNTHKTTNNVRFMLTDMRRLVICRFFRQKFLGTFLKKRGLVAFLTDLMVRLTVLVMHLPFPMEFVGYWKISAAACKKIREELTSFLCHYRNKLIFGYNQREGDGWRAPCQKSRQAFRQGGKRRPPGIYTNTHAQKWSSEDFTWHHVTCAAQCGSKGRYRVGMGDTSRCKGCWVRNSRELDWSHTISLFLLTSDPGPQASAMDFALTTLRLMCLAWLWPVALLKGSNTQNQRRHKDVYLGENTRHKHGGWGYFY